MWLVSKIDRYFDLLCGPKKCEKAWRWIGKNIENYVMKKHWKLYSEIHYKKIEVINSEWSDNRRKRGYAIRSSEIWSSEMLLQSDTLTNSRLPQFSKRSDTPLYVISSQKSRQISISNRHLFAIRRRPSSVILSQPQKLISHNNAHFLATADSVASETLSFPTICIIFNSWQPSATAIRPSSMKLLMWEMLILFRSGQNS